jgi:hypothetical protein
VKKFKVRDYTDDVVNRFLESEIQKEGLLNKRALESFERYMVLNRPFRRITLTIDGLGSDSSLGKTSIALIDEDFAGLITDTDHMFLLWRPRLVELLKEGINDDEEIDQYPGNEKAVQEVLDELIRLRWRGQERDEDLKPKLRSLQADPLSAIAFIVPRSPGGIRREEKLLGELGDSHAYVLASSLVTNSSPRDVILSCEIGERVYVETIVAEYRNIESNATRLLLLETPGTSSLREAKKKAGALMRICQLYESCYNRIHERFLM